MVQTAWVGDDAYITFRSLENLLRGYGPVYNVGERVQTFTHPLWFLLQALTNAVMGWWPGNPFGTGQLYFVSVFLSIAISVFSVMVLCLGIARGAGSAILAVLLLCLSKAFIDYSTSGLENPLSHLLAFCFVALYAGGPAISHRRIFALGLCAGLAGLNRPDLILLFLPALALLAWSKMHQPRHVAYLALGFAPLLAWEMFSLFYYGSLVPNTAIAKLHTGIEQSQLVGQGVLYFRNSLHLDPITLVTVAAVGLWSMCARQRPQIALWTGIALYLGYALWIGGDFMSGRHFSAPFAVAVAIGAGMRSWSPKPFSAAFAAALLLGLLPLYVVPERGLAYGDDAKRILYYIDSSGIADERLYYFPDHGLLTSFAQGAPAGYAHADWVYLDRHPAEVVVLGPLGVAGFYNGPNVHVIDRNALADPLMARMPMVDPARWRIGHFHHIIPDGYLDTLRWGTNMIRDPGIAAYYDKLSLVTQGPLWNWRRIVETWNLNTGRNEHLLPNHRVA
ncbi:MAG TPA: hypothetical protein VLY63_31705, partial [Anaerolineae bacterium]|nr:hypothetical protein [Anaerolineae bacterium]